MEELGGTRRSCGLYCKKTRRVRFVPGLRRAGPGRLQVPSPLPALSTASGGVQTGRDRIPSWRPRYASHPAGRLGLQLNPRHDGRSTSAAAPLHTRRSEIHSGRPAGLRFRLVGQHTSGNGTRTATDECKRPMAAGARRLPGTCGLRVPSQPNNNRPMWQLKLRSTSSSRCRGSRHDSVHSI